jgi:DNA-binding transcriptional MocR family regulator
MHPAREATQPPPKRSHHLLSPEATHRIIWLRDAEKSSWRQIAAELDIKASTAQSAYNRWKTEGVFRKKLGRKRSFDVELKQEVIEHILEGHCLNGHWQRVHRVHHAMDPANVPEEPTSAEGEAQD